MKGFSLLEVIIALGILAVGLVSVLVLANFAISSSAVSQGRLIAAHLAQEGIELVRSIRDANWLEEESWDNGLSSCTNCGLDYDDSSLDSSLDYLNTSLKIDGGFYNYNSGDNTIFRRAIDIDNDGTRIKIICLVKWEEHGRLHTLTISDELYNWQ